MASREADPWLGMFTVALAAGHSMLDAMGSVVNTNEGAGKPRAQALRWATPNHVALDLATMRLRDFSRAATGEATVIIAPFALHTAVIADYARGHSIVEALRREGVERLFVTEWKSATSEMRDFSIDTYLADLNVVVDDLGAPVNLVGLCQGGWLALVFAARFPHKVRRLVMVGAPIDTHAGDSTISRLAQTVPMERYDEIVRAGEGRLLGRVQLTLWPGSAPGREEIVRTLQCAEAAPSAIRALERRFRRWHFAVLDLPGVYYRQTVRWLYKENQLARNRFVALGRRISLTQITTPLFLLAARDDDITAPEQLLAVRSLVATSPGRIEARVVDGNHLSLFMGGETLTAAWQDIGRWLDQAPRVRAVA